MQFSIVVEDNFFVNCLDGVRGATSAVKEEEFVSLFLLILFMAVLS